MSNRAQRAFWGLFTDLGCHVVLTASTLLLTPLVLAFTSKSLYGSWQAALSILSYLAMLDAGLGFSLVRLVASATSEKADTALNSLASVALFSFTAIGAVVLAIGLFVSSRIPYWFHVPASETGSLVNAYRIAAFAAAAALPLGTFNGVLVGMQRTAQSGAIRTVGAILGALVSFVLLEAHFGISALAIGNFTTSTFVGLSALFVTKKLRPGLSFGLRFLSREGFTALWHCAGYFQLVRIAYVIALNTDPLIIAAFLGASEVTPYVITARMAIMFSVVLADKPPSAVYPALAQMYARTEMEALRRGFLALVYYSTRLALIGAILVALLNPAFVLLWVGRQGFGGSVLNGVFIYWVLLDTVLRGSSIIPLVTGEMRVWAIASLGEALVNVLLSLLLVRSFGLVGVAAGTAVARTFITGLVIPIWSCKKLDLRIRDFFVRGIFNAIVRVLPAILFTTVLAGVLLPAWGWFRLGIIGLAAVATNIAVFEGPKWLRSRNCSMEALIKAFLTPDLHTALPANRAK
jgi:O-antigen/teichoic acid export membrane protein